MYTERSPKRSYTALINDRTSGPRLGYRAGSHWRRSVGLWGGQPGRRLWQRGGYREGGVQQGTFVPAFVLWGPDGLIGPT